MALLRKTAGTTSSRESSLSRMADRTVAMMDTPMSPLDSGPSDDLLAVLDEILDFTPKEAASTDSLAQQALGASYIADAFEFPEVPNPYEQQPVEEPKPALLEAKVEQTATFVPIVTKQSAQRQKQQHQSAQREKDVCTMTCPTPKRRRKRPKDELDYLRAKVAGLEEELACLNRSTGRFSSISDIEKEMFARWKLIAERQKEEANRTIVENMKLRTMLKAQFEIAKRRQMMMAEYHQQTMPQSLPWNFIKTEFNFFDVEDVDGPRVPSISDETIFAQLNGSLEAQYAQVSSVLQANGIADVNRELLGKIHLKQNMNGISFGIHEVRLVPFAMQSVERIMWSLVGDKINEVPGRTQIINNNHQNFKIGNTLEFPKSQHTKTSSRFAMRRYFEGNRIIFVWSACVEIAGSVFVRLREKGCVTISSFNLTGSELSRCEGSILRCVIDVEPETVKFSTGADPKKNIKEMTDLVLAAYNRRFDTFNQSMESLLLQDLRASSA